MKALTVKATILKAKKGVGAKCHVRIRITKDRKSYYLPTGLMANVDDFDNKLGRFKEIYRNNAQKIVLHKNYNSQLEKRINEIKINLSELPTSTPLSARRALNAIVTKDKEGSKSVSEYFDHVIDTLKTSGSIGTRKAYIYARNKLEKFGGKELTFNEITEELLKNYIKYLKKDGQASNNIYFHIKMIRALYNRAIADKIATKKSYLEAFENLKPNTLIQKTKHRALSNAEVDELKKFKPRNEQETLALAVFFFSYYNGGINIKDLACLKADDIKGGVIKYTRKKTHETIILPLHEKSFAILNEVKNDSPYLFPILLGCDDTNELKVFNRINLNNNLINKSLKDIGEALELSIPLTTYVARHTYSTRLLRGGASIEQISQALNHKDKKTTQVYLDRFANDEIAKLGKLL